MVSGTLASAAAGLQIVLAAVLIFIAVRAYRRVKATRMAMLGLVFLVFLIQGVVLAVGLLTTRLVLETAATAAMALTALALLIIYLGVLKP